MTSNPYQENTNMPLPSLIALPSKKPNNAQCDDLNLHMLPSELLAKILSFVDGDPCEQKFLQMCKCDSQFAGACRNDKLWEALCKRQRWDRPERTTGWHDMGKLTWKQQFFKWCDLRFKPYRPEEFNRIFKRPMRAFFGDSEIDDNKTGRLKLRFTLEMLMMETDGTGVLPETPPELSKFKLETEAAKEVRKYGPIESWDVSRVTDMQGLFSPFYAVLYENISDYYKSLIIDCLLDFELDISGWDVSNVTNMKGMFNGAYLFNADISEWNVSNVTNMSYMFYESEAFNADIGGWNVSNVTDMSFMFYGAEAFNADISRWNVMNVRNMRYMFKNSVFNQDLTEWNAGERLHEDVDVSFMFQNSSLTQYPDWF